MFEESRDWDGSRTESVLLDPPTQEEIDLIAGLSAESLAELKASARRQVGVGQEWEPGVAEWWEAEDDPPVADWDALQRLRDPTADELAQHPTGATLAFALDDADAARLDDYTAVELVAAWYRLTAWAQAGAAHAAADLAQRESMSGAGEPTAEPDAPTSAAQP